jgi:Uma2 family endonuclease
MAAAFFAAIRKTLPVFACISVRLRIRPGLILIPDVSVFYPTKPQQAVPDTPPLVAIEILSLDDRLTKVQEKLEEYHVRGLPHVWLVDPRSHRLYTCNGSLKEVPRSRFPS